MCQWNCCKSIVSQWFCYNYGESWDSSCEKSWFGLLCNQTVSLKTDSKTLYYSILKLKYSLSISKHNKGEKKYASLNNSHNNCHRNNMNGIFLQIQMFRSIDQSLHPTGCNHELFSVFGDFMHQGRRMQRKQNHWLAIEWGISMSSLD